MRPLILFSLNVRWIVISCAADSRLTRGDSHSCAVCVAALDVDARTLPMGGARVLDQFPDFL